MKKVYLGLVALLVSLTLSAERVSLDDATLVANNFMNPATSSMTKKAMPAKRMVHKAVAEDNLYYVYQNADGEGWVIVAANDAVTPILAYSETGTFRTDNLPVNVRAWMGKYNNFIRRIEADGVEATEETKAEWRSLRKGVRRATSAVVVGPLIQTQWDQDAPYYNLCPGTGSNKAYTGCVATAMAQVMKYWEWPVQGTGSHSYRPLDVNNPYNEYTGQPNYSSRYTSTLTADIGNTTYDWAHMLDSYTGTYTNTQATAVATLMYHCGVATEMMYGNDADGGSGTYTVNYGDWNWGITTTDEMGCAQNAFPAYFGYKQEGLIGYVRDGYSEGGTVYYQAWSDNDWTAMIKAELDLQHPIMYGGADSGGGGHSFICDGYRDDNYFHFNWGWSGSNDGYYRLSSLRPGSGGAGGGSYNFSEDQDVLIGIVPDREDIQQDPDTVIWSVQGVETPVEYTHNSALVLPTAPADCECGRVFVGWTAQSTITNGQKPNDLFTEAGSKRVTANVTYYAVFAEQEGEGGEPTTVASVTFKSADSDSNQDNSSNIATKLVETATGISAYSGSKLYVGKNGMKMGSSSAIGTITLTLDNTVSVSKVVINSTKYGSDTGKLKVTAGTTELGSQSPASNLEFTANPAVTTNTITVETSSKRAYVSSISIIAGSGATYKNFTLNCNCSGTDVENLQLTPTTRKIIYNGQVYILREGRTYTLTGQEIKN